MTTDAARSSLPLYRASPPASRAAPVEDLVSARDTPVRARLGLQRRAPANMRRHPGRAAHPVTGVVVADLSSFFVMRGVVRPVRGYPPLGGRGCGGGPAR